MHNRFMNEEAASSPITARVVPEGQSASILPRYVGARLMMLCEGAIFDSMRELSADYEGGSWTFLELVVATGFYMRLGKDRGEIAMSSGRAIPRVRAMARPVIL